MSEDRCSENTGVSVILSDSVLMYFHRVTAGLFILPSTTFKKENKNMKKHRKNKKERNKPNVKT